ncbi:polysaccharide deacetylase [Methylocystis sp.]|uniref:polysaccharide deacetylase n=1 Tax=Methylocystis sp. TaxID=1911079 RepID=UPI003D146DD3
MNPELMPIGRCAEMAGLRSHELVLGVSPSDKHQHMLALYRRAVSLDAARGLVVAEIRSAVKIGAARRAADLLIVLRWLLAPGASLDDSRTAARPRRRIPSARWRRATDPSALAQESSKRGGEIVLFSDSGRQRR